MKKFYYKAIKDRKDVVTGFVDAQTREEARQKVCSLGLMPSKIYEETSPQAVSEVREIGRPTVSSIGLADKILFTSELQLLLQAGISVIEALETLGRHAPNRTVARFSLDLCEKLKTGATLSDAVNVYKKQLGVVYVSLVKTGEVSGALPQILKYLTTFLKKQQTLKDKYIQMMIYPCFLVLAIIGIFFLFGGFVFPKIIEMASVSPSDIPPMAAWVINSVSFFKSYWWMIILAGGTGIYGLKLLGQLKTLTDLGTKFAMKLPVFGNCLRYLSLTHYMSVLQVAYDAGVPIINSLDLAQSSVSNNVLRAEAQKVARLVENGSELGDAFMKSEFLPPIFMSLVSTGEKTGQLGKMFRDIAIGIEQKLDMATVALSKFFEMGILLTMGAAVAYLIICFFQMYGAVFSNF